MTLVLFEFYLTARKALTNSIPLSGGAADVSGFARSFARSFRDAVLFGQGGADDVVRCTKVLRRPHHDDPATSTHRLLLSYSFLSLLLSTFPFLSTFLVSCLRASPFHPPPLQALLRLTREAAERSVPFLAPILHRFRPSAMPPSLSAILSLFIIPFASPAVPQASSPFFIVLARVPGVPQSLLSLHSRPLVLYPILCYA